MLTRAKTKVAHTRIYYFVIHTLLLLVADYTMFAVTTRVRETLALS